eukprot:1644696-Amphidinium_carterae.1
MPADEETTQIKASVNVNLFDSLDGVYSVENLETPILIGFHVAGDGGNVECAYWDTMLASWSTHGVSVAASTNTSLVCATTHLSLFGAIVRGFTAAFECSQ